MKIHKSITEQKLIDAVSDDNMIGFCIACGNEQGDCEPDARRYKCEECGAMEVFGAEELIVRTA